MTTGDTENAAFSHYTAENTVLCYSQVSSFALLDSTVLHQASPGYFLGLSTHLTAVQN